MGLASTRPPSLARESLTSSKLILATPSMSQGFHQGSNIFSFSDEFNERPQQHHLAQQSRRGKLIRPLQGFFEVDSTAVEAISVGNPLQAPMEEEEEEEEEEEVPGIYGAAPPTAGANNILPEMFNFPGAPADLLSCQNSPPAGYHRFQQRPAAGFLDAADSWPYAGSRQGLVSLMC